MTADTLKSKVFICGLANEARQNASDINLG
jgi:hypothetical protein